MVTIYKYFKEDENYYQKEKSKFIDPNIINKNNEQDDYDGNNNDDESISINKQIVTSINVTKDSNLSEDPILGIKLLGEMALKSSHLRDYDVVNSLRMGLFRILIFVYANEEKLGLPFTISSQEDMNVKKLRKLSLIKKPKDQDTIDYKDEKSKEGKQQREQKEENGGDEEKKTNKERIIIINPRELKIQVVIMTTLTNISNGIIKRTNTSSNEFICKQYISVCNYLLENTKVDEFQQLTEWYSYHILLIKKEFSDSLLLLPILNLLSQFKEDMNLNYPFAIKTFSVFMDKFLLYKDKITDNYRKDIK